MGEPDAMSPPDTSPVEIKVAADLGQLPILRALAETVALLSDLTLEEVSDIRLAVDEVASSLIVGATPGSTVCCEFTIGRNTMRVRVSAVSAQESLPDQNGFGWHVLRTLTDSISAGHGPYDDTVSGYPTAIEFRKARSTP